MPDRYRRGMLAGRMPILSENRLPELRAVLQTGLRGAAESVGEMWDDLIDPTVTALLLDGLRQCGADEGTVWLLNAEREFLIPRFNSGPRAADFVGRFRQSLRSGMISMVVAMELPICENGVHGNSEQDPSLDRALDLVFSKDIQLPRLCSAAMSEPEGPSTGGAQKHDSGTLEHSGSRQ